MPKPTREPFGDFWLVITAFCPRCWFKGEAKFHATVTEGAVRRFFQHRHDALHNHDALHSGTCSTCGPCTQTPRIPRYDNPPLPLPDDND